MGFGGMFYVAVPCGPGPGTDESNDEVADPKLAPEASGSIAADVPGAKVVDPQLAQKAAGAVASCVLGCQVLRSQKLRRRPEVLLFYACQVPRSQVRGLCNRLQMPPLHVG